MAYEFYQQYLKTASSSSTDYYKEVLQEMIDDQFDNSSNYYVIKKKDISTGVFNDIGVRLVTPYDISTDKVKIKDDFFQIIFKNFTVNSLLGDIYEFNGHRYMTVDISKSKTPTNSCRIQRCNVQLNFTESTPLTSNIISIDGIATNKLLDTASNQYVVLPQGEMLAKIPYDIYSKKIKYTSGGGTRFLMGDPVQAWQCIGIDSISSVRYSIDKNYPSSGFVELRLKQVAIDSARDNFVGKVAWQYYFS